MSHRLQNSLAALVAFSSFSMFEVTSSADDAKPSPDTIAPVSAPAMPEDLPRSVQDITDAVLRYHVDPPARQQMTLSGLKALYRAAAVPAPAELARRVSEIVSADQLAALLRESWPKTIAPSLAPERLGETLLQGLLAPVPGRAELMTDKERRVAEQMAGNRYVGIHISLSWDDEVKRPKMHGVFEGGPAARAGIKAGDILEEVDGVNTEGKTLREIVDRLRGDDGTDVTIKVRDAKGAKFRTVTLTRGQLPRSTIQGLGKNASGGWILRADETDAIGYLKVNEIAASTPHELRKLAAQMESEGIRSLVLDLRDVSSEASPTVLHSAVLLADSLLESGTIGRIQTPHGEMIHQADADALFRGWPIAVLVDRGTSGTAEWVAAALQDNHRAVLVGWPTQGTPRSSPPGRLAVNGMPGDRFRPLAATVRTTIPVGDGRWAISLLTGYLERGDGRPLVDPGTTTLDAPSREEKAQGGVQPDHPLAADSEQSPSHREAGENTYGVVKPAEPAQAARRDPAIDAAKTILHKVLEKR